jgi:hypothetical protein
MLLMDETKLAQRREALLRANDVRTYWKQTKEDLAACRVTLEAVLAERDPRLDTMVAYDLVRAVPGVGKTKALAWVREVRLTPSSTVGRMTARQRTLMMALDMHHRGRSDTWRRKSALRSFRDAQR